MRWVLIIVTVWIVVAFLAAILIGRSIRLADRKAARARAARARTANVVVDRAGIEVAGVLPLPPPGPEAAETPAGYHRRLWTTIPRARRPIQSSTPPPERATSQGRTHPPA